MSEWLEYRLGDVGTFSYGKMPKKEALNTGIYPTFSGYKYQYFYPEFNCSKNDLIVVARGVGGTGDVKIVKEKCYLTNLSLKMDFDKETVNSKFIYYYYNIETLRYLDSGSAQSQITITDLSNAYITLPPLPEQKAIAEVLSSLDDKIDLLHRQNKTLEQMAETLFRQWFVEEAGEDWEEGVLSEEFDFTMGQSPPGGSFNEAGIGIPMFQGNADFGFRFPTERIFTTEQKRLAKPFDTLISVRAPVGAQNMAEQECCIGRGVAAFRYKDNHEFYTYTYFKLESLMEEIKKFNDEGTVFGSISKGDFQKMEVVIPPEDLVSKFESEVKPINDKVIKNCRQIRTLESLRDTLLPKLMSGEIRVNLSAEAL
ncbi:restriction endonuclease subunit S [Ectothiorhodospiraceae bacterium BW-2]|nr:restriction endonuclease subunit S [Ectothiorhodospiraceae bacterium BW-2]